MRVAIIGAGWAGLAAAVRAVQAGHHVTVFEAARTPGGRARALALPLPDGRELSADNGQHILIGAYTDTLRLMRTVGVAPEQALLRMPLALTYPDGAGLALPDWPAPLDAAWGIARARGWRPAERLALLRAAWRWQRSGFTCAPHVSVAALCQGLPQRLQREFIEPLCVSALNTPLHEASGAVFLRVLHDALWRQRGGSNLLLPRTDLGALFPEPALRWLQARGAAVRLGRRVRALHATGSGWRVDGEAFDAAIVATAAHQALHLQVGADASLPAPAAARVDAAWRAWQSAAAALRFTAISTVYAQAVAPAPAPTTAAAALLPRPMLALRASADGPAQFVFAHDQIRDLPPGAPPTHVLAFVISDSRGERAALEAAVAAQARAQLGLPVTVLRTVTEKRATFACTPALARPPAHVAPGLAVCGDDVQGPYPATLEGAVRSGWQALDALDAPDA
ncbi:MAG: hydroxysqualene dehydroxylase HpnE [Comamonadaceae bacterium]|nr:hydroxysqualene dehydroxylase HpnE [Comamonadaceae bacterium]